MKKTILILLLTLACVIIYATATYFVNIETTGPFVVTHTSGCIEIVVQLDGSLTNNTPNQPNNPNKRIALSYSPFYDSNPTWLSEVTTTAIDNNFYRISLPYLANNTEFDREGWFRIDLQYYSESEGMWISYSSSQYDTMFYDQIFQFRDTVVNPYQAAITNAADNSTVIIPAGVHVGHLIVGGKTNLTIKGAGSTGANKTTIKSAGHASAITITGCTNLKIQNMEITNGKSSNGGGINCEFSTVTVENCLIRNNALEQLYSGGSSSSMTKGGAIYLGEGQSVCTVKTSTILDNDAQEGRTAYVFSGILNFDACNLLQSQGGSNYVTMDSDFIFWNSIVSSVDTNYGDFNYCCIYNPNLALRGVNNISTNDPMFTDPSSGDYSLQKGSPCIGTGYNPAYDDPLVEGYDQNLITMKDETQDIGAVNYPWDRYASYTFTDDPDGNWMCFPVLDDLSTITIDGNTYSTDIMRAFFYQYETNPSHMNNVSYRWYGTEGFGTNWHFPSTPSNAQMKRYLGYKALFDENSTLPETGTFHGYQIPYTEPVPVPEPETENWIGYFLPETQTPQVAFGSFMDELYFIQGKNWAGVRLKPSRTAPWIWGIGQQNPTISYGDMVVVKKLRDSTQNQFTWTRFSSVPEYERVDASHFSFKKEPNYIPIFVEVDSLTAVEELAVFINGTCYGASVVDGTVIMIQAYIDSVSDGADIRIVAWDGAKSSNVPLALQVYNRDVDAFIPSASITKEDCDFYYVKLEQCEVGAETPSPFTLAISNYPNPFNPSTTISFEIPNDTHVNLDIYNAKGQLVKRLVNSFKAVGKHSVMWDGRDDNGNKASSGIYFTKIVTDTSTLTSKMLMLK